MKCVDSEVAIVRDESMYHDTIWRIYNWSNTGRQIQNMYFGSTKSSLPWRRLWTAFNGSSINPITQWSDRVCDQGWTTSGCANKPKRLLQSERLYALCAHTDVGRQKVGHETCCSIVMPLPTEKSHDEFSLYDGDDDDVARTACGLLHGKAWVVLPQGLLTTLAAIIVPLFF